MPLKSEVKQCTKCKKILPLDSFHRHKPSKDGRKPKCKDCRCQQQRDYIKKYPDKKRDQDKKYRLENADKIRKKNKKYRRESIEKIKIKDKKYRKDNSERLRIYFQEHYIKNRDVKLAQVKQYTNSNREAVRSYQKQYRIDNADKLKEYQRLNRLENRELYRMYGLNYLARKNGAKGDYSIEQWGELCNFFENKCPCCDCLTDSFEADHIIPLSWDKTSNWITNIQPLCKSCNSSKNNYYAVDYRPKDVRKWAMEQLNES